MSRIHLNFTYSSECHELNASHEEISQRCVTPRFLHKPKNSIEFLESSKSSKRKEVNVSHTPSLCTSGDLLLKRVLLLLERVLLLLERVLLVECCFGMSPLNILNSISYLIITNSISYLNITNSTSHAPRLSAATAARCMYELFFGMLNLDESSKYKGTQESSNYHPRRKIHLNVTNSMHHTRKYHKGVWRIDFFAFWRVTEFVTCKWVRVIAFMKGKWGARDVTSSSRRSGGSLFEWVLFWSGALKRVI